MEGFRCLCPLSNTCLRGYVIIQLVLDPDYVTAINEWIGPLSLLNNDQR